MTPEAVQVWLERYVTAWRSNDADEIGSLFSSDARYRFVPWYEPVVGRDAIVAAWQEDFDESDSWTASYASLSVTDDLVLATGRTTYLPDEITFENLFLLRFDDAGQCTEFTDWYMKHPVEETADA